MREDFSAPPHLQTLAPEGKRQGCWMDPQLQYQAGRGPLCPQDQRAPSWAWLLEWASDSRTMGMKPSPIPGKGKVCWKLGPLRPSDGQVGQVGQVAGKGALGL